MTSYPRTAACLPNFLLVGAHKAATTSISEALRQHPEIFIPSVKEPHYFVHELLGPGIPDCVRSWERYVELFTPSLHHIARGEASVLYLYYHKLAIPAIKQALGDDVRIIISLREPVSRAYSAYIDARQSATWERLSFADALAAEDSRVVANVGLPTMHYRRVGLYAAQVAAYLEAFKNVRIVFFEDFIAAPSSVVAELHEFLGCQSLAPSLGPAIHSNAGGRAWSSEVLRRVALNGPVSWGRRRLRSRFPGAYARARELGRGYLMKDAEALEPAVQARLRDSYRTDIRELAAMVGRDLGHWLDGGEGGLSRPASCDF